MEPRAQTPPDGVRCWATSGFFRDEDIDDAKRPIQVGVPTELHFYPGVFHGAETFAPEADHSIRFLRNQFAALTRALHDQ